MRYPRPRFCLVMAAALALASGATASDATPVAAFGSSVAAVWDGIALECPGASYEWFGATPETLYCFRVEMSGLSIRSRLSGLLEERGTWLNAWRQETPELVSRPLWADGAVYRIVVATNFRSARDAVVFIRHSAVD
jgi:hypothetical protein